MEESLPALFDGAKKKNVIKAKGYEIAMYSNIFEEEFISLTDIAKYRNKDNPTEVISLWLRTFSTIEYLGLWEILHNPGFKPHIYEGFKMEAARPSFWMSPQKWVKETGAAGIIAKSGRYGGTFAHSDIAFKFAAWISAEFELYIIKDYHRLKQDEAERKSLDWNLHKEIFKLNYKMQTDSLVLPELTEEQISNTYASEADLLNVALFGMTAREWVTKHKDTGDLRDNANLHQLLVLANMESYNAVLIEQGCSQSERLVALHELAERQLRLITKEEVGELPRRR